MKAVQPFGYFMMQSLSDSFPVSQDAYGRRVQTITCSLCGTEGFNNAKDGRGSEAVLATYFRSRGWKFDTKRGHECPDCVKRKMIESRKKNQPKGPEPLQIQQPADPTLSIPREELVLRRKVLDELLFQHYDVSAQNYHPGATDKMIAMKCELPEDIVAKRREADFGPVRLEPTRDEKLAMRMEAVETALQTFRGSLEIEKTFRSELSAWLSRYLTSETIETASRVEAAFSALAEEMKSVVHEQR